MKQFYLHVKPDTVMVEYEGYFVEPINIEIWTHENKFIISMKNAKTWGGLTTYQRFYEQGFYKIIKNIILTADNLKLIEYKKEDLPKWIDQDRDQAYAKSKEEYLNSQEYKEMSMEEPKETEEESVQWYLYPFC